MMPLSLFGKKVGLLLLVFSFILSVFMPAISFAATPSAYEFLDTKTERWLRFRGIYGCMYEKGLPFDSPTQVYQGHFFNGGSTAIGYLNDDGKVSCDDDGFVDNSLKIIGFQDNAYAYCAAQPSSYRTGGPDTQTGSDVEGCVNGDGSFNNAEDHKKIAAQWFTGLKAQIKDYKSFVTDSGGQPEESKYYMYYQSLTKFCGASRGEKWTNSREQQALVDGDPQKVVISEVDAQGKATSYIFNLKKDKTDTVDDIYNNMGSDSDDFRCADMAKRTVELSPAVASWISTYNENNPDAPQTPISNAGEGDVDDSVVCSAGALGWIFCPLSEFMVETVTGVAGFLEGMLTYAPLIGSERGDALKAMWGIVLVIANVGLIAGFLVVVFSQATSIGLSSYGIKRLLPRIIAAAILMNLSFYVCAIAIDIANILGVSIKGIVDAGMEVVIANKAGDSRVEAGMGWGEYAVLITGGLMLTAAYITGAIALLLPVLISAVLAVLTAFLILAAREVIITLLVILAPLAFLAWILPNTESWFTKWRKLFTTMLLLFPLIMAVFYGAVLVSSLIMATHQNGEGAKNINDFMVNVLAFAVLVVPLFSLPFIMKSAGGVLDRLGILVNNKNRGLVDRSRKVGQESYARTRGKRAANYDPTRTGLARRKNFSARLANRPFLGVTEDQRARARFNVAQRGDQYEAEQTKLAAATLSQRGITGDKHALYDVASNKKNNTFLRRAAAAQMGEIGAADKLEDLFSGKADPTTGIRSGVDEEQKRIAAKAIGYSAAKLSGPANPLFFEAVTYESNKKKGLDEAAAIAEGRKVREQKVISQMGSGYLTGLKADQILGARKTIEAIANPGEKAAAIDSVRSAIQTISNDPRQLNNMTDEQVVELGKMAQRLGVSTAGVAPALTDRYTNAANAALAAHNAGTKPIDPHEMPTVPTGGGW